MARQTAKKTENAPWAARLRSAVDQSGGPSAVARRADFPLSTLNEYLSGTEMKLGRAAKIAEACNVTLDWLATGAVAPKTTPERPFFDHDLILKPVNYYMIASLIETFQNVHAKSDKPTLKKLFEWIEALYGMGHDLPDRKFKIVNAEDVEP